MNNFIVKSPTRVDLSGGTLDLWPLYCVLGKGLTINIAVNLFLSVRFEIPDSNSFKIEILSETGESFSFTELPSTETIESLGLSLRFPVTIVRSYFKEKEPLSPMHLKISISSNVPIGSGLGGSSAMCVAIARGLSQIFGDYTEQGWQWKILDWVKDIEAGFLKTPTGTQDYLASLLGGLNSFRYKIGGIEHIPYHSDIFEEVSKRIIIVYSGLGHQSGVSNWEVIKAVLSGDKEMLGNLNSIAELSEELDAELRSGSLNWKYIGRCMNEEWLIRKKIFKVETERLQKIIDFLLEQKVYGAKVCGAAQGGCIVALVSPEEKPNIAANCTKAKIKVLPAEGISLGVSIIEAS